MKRNPGDRIGLGDPASDFLLRMLCPGRMALNLPKDVLPIDVWIRRYNAAQTEDGKLIRIEPPHGRVTKTVAGKRQSIELEDVALEKLRRENGARALRMLRGESKDWLGFPLDDRRAEMVRKILKSES